MHGKKRSIRTRSPVPGEKVHLSQGNRHPVSLPGFYSYKKKKKGGIGNRENKAELLIGKCSGQKKNEKWVADIRQVAREGPAT